MEINNVAKRKLLAALRRPMYFWNVTVGFSLTLVSPLLAADVLGGAAGLEVQGVRCANSSTGTVVSSSETTTEWDCLSLGLEAEAGDRVTATVVGRVPQESSMASVAPLFDTTEIFEEGDGFAAADFDLDGDPDILMADDFQWLEQVAGDPPSFLAHLLDKPAGEFGAIEALAADMDGDGRPDVVGTFFFAASIEWQRNLGGTPPTFERFTVHRDAGWRPWRIEEGDLDGDGDTDLLSWRQDLDGVGLTRQRLAWHENQGAQFVTHELYESESNVAFSEIEPGVVDLDGDGDNDILAGDCSTLRMLWFENDGASPPGFELRIIQDDGTLAPSRFAAEDLDLDGDVDVVAESNGEARIYENLGGSPMTFAIHDLAELGGQSPVVGDLNSDGRPDIVFRSFAVKGLRWLENRGDLSFVLHSVREVDHDLTGPLPVDLDGNGDMDLVSSTDATPVVRIDAKTTVGAWNFGTESNGVTCRNLSTGQTVRELVPGRTVHDCEAMGLSVDPGDRILISVRGVVE